MAELTVESSGQVTEIEVQSGETPFADALLQALRTWRFTPGTGGGTVSFRVEADFVPAAAGGPNGGPAAGRPAPRARPRRDAAPSARAAARRRRRAAPRHGAAPPPEPAAAPEPAAVARARAAPGAGPRDRPAAAAAAHRRPPPTTCRLRPGRPSRRRTGLGPPAGAPPAQPPPELPPRLGGPRRDALGRECRT